MWIWPRPPAVFLILIAGCAAPAERRAVQKPDATPAPATAQTSRADPVPAEVSGQDSATAKGSPAAGAQTTQTAQGETPKPESAPSSKAAGSTPPEDPKSATPQDSEKWASPQNVVHEGGSIAIHGYLSSQYRGRWANSEADNDLYEFLAVDVGDPTKDKWTAHLSARMSVDLDGAPPSDTPPIFFGLADTYDSAVNARLYEAHVDGTDIGPFAEMKIGRQIDYETPVYAWFDGAYLQTKSIGDHKLDFGAYGGVPVYMFESSTSGDVQAGAFAESKLWSQAKGRLDYMYLEDTTSTGYHSDNLWRLGVWQDLGQNLHFEGNYSRLNDHNRDWALRANWAKPEDDLTVQVSFYQLLEGQQDLALPIDPFYTSLFELFPFFDARFLISKGFGEKWNLQAGFDSRQVTDSADEGDFNHDFYRYFLTAVMSDVLPAGLVLSVTGEVWDGGSTGIVTSGADLSRRFGGKLDGAIGTYYALYKNDLFSQDEQQNVRAYYLKLRYHQGQSLIWDLRYEYESDDFGPFNTLVLGLVWHF